MSEAVPCPSALDTLRWRSDHSVVLRSDVQFTRYACKRPYRQYFAYPPIRRYR